MRYWLVLLGSFYGWFLAGQEAYYPVSPLSLEPYSDSLVLGVLHDVNQVDIPVKVYRNMDAFYALIDFGDSSSVYEFYQSGFIQEISWHDYNGGMPELSVVWHYQAGNSGRYGGSASQDEVLIIYDFEQAQELLQISLYASVETWWQTYNEEEMHDNPKAESRVIEHGGDHTCSELETVVLDSIIRLVPVFNKRCAGLSSELDEDEEFNEKGINLVWRKDGFYQK